MHCPWDNWMCIACKCEQFCTTLSAPILYFACPSCFARNFQPPLQIYYLAANGIAPSGFSAVTGSSAVFFGNLPTIVFAYTCQPGKQCGFDCLSVQVCYKFCSNRVCFGAQHAIAIRSTLVCCLRSLRFRVLCRFFVARILGCNRPPPLHCN